MTTVRFFAAFFVALWFAPAMAADLSIGVVNLSRLLAEAPQAKAAMQVLQREFEPRKNIIVALEDEVIATAEELQRNAATMGEAELRAARLKLREKERDLGRQQERYLDDFNKRRNDALGKLQRSLMDEVNAFAERQHYDLIIGEGVLFANVGEDVTAQVLVALRTRFDSSQ